MSELFEPSSLSDEELLDAFIPTSASKQLLREYPTVYDVVFHAPQTALSKVSGMGEKRMQRMLCMKEIYRRMERRSQNDIPTIHGPEDVERCFAFLKDVQHEEFWALLLDTKNHVKGKKIISKGSLTASVVHPREVFKEAVAHLAASLILVHNHPSGTPDPSREDISVTERLVKAGRVMDIPVLDHVVVGSYGYCSMKEHGAVSFNK